MNKKTVTVAEFKAKFSEMVKAVNNGHEIAVTYGRNKKVVGYFVSEPKTPQQKRRLNRLSHSSFCIDTDHWEMTEEEFLER